MKLMMLTVLVLAIAMALFIMLPNLAWAQDGGAIYKAKCAACHGPDGAGKVGPAVKGISMSEAQITDLLTKGEAGKKAPHGKAVAGLSVDQAKSVAAFVKSLK
ncbi:MAG TPA: cytochrome c [Terriglobales bacterium]|nr:cytochrome c [Terriglobales bacterium]